MTSYRTGSGPHTGVHLIIVRSDLGAIVHKHPPIRAGGRITEQITLPTPGRYRVVIDAYPKLSGPLRNFQLFRSITVAGKAAPRPLPPFRPTISVAGYRFVLKHPPSLHAIRPDHDQRDRPERAADEVHAVVRRVGARDLLPSRIARLLPHACLLRRNERVHERSGPDTRHRKCDQARAAPRWRSASRAGHLAALLAVQG